MTGETRMFKNLDADSIKQVKRATIGTMILTVIMILIFVALKFLFKNVDFINNKINLLYVLLGGAAGALVAILNFYYLAYSIGQRTTTEDEELAKSRYELSKRIRLFIQVGWMVAAILVPVFNAVAAIFPLFFPRRSVIIMGIIDAKRENKNEGTGGELDQQ